MNKNFKKALGLFAVAAIALSGCTSNSATKSDAKEETLLIGASPVPHAKILEYVAKELAPKEGFKLEIKQYTDYVQPNTALAEGDLDGNYYQHVPYLEKSEKDGGYDLSHGKGIHIEPLALYSKNVKKVADLKEGAKVGITNDPSNQHRAILLLASQGLLKLDPNVQEYTIHTGILENPKKIEFVEADPAALPRTLDSLDLAVINCNFALEAGLSPAKDAVAIEEAKNNPYANILARRADLSGSKLKLWEKLEKLLHSKEVREYIKKTWSDGSVIPAF